MITIRRPVTKRCPFRDETDEGELVITFPGDAPELHDLDGKVDALCIRPVTHEEFTRNLAAMLRTASVTTTWRTGTWTVKVEEGKTADSLTYFATASSPATIKAMSAGKLAVMTSYTHMLLPEGAEWAMDNGCFGDRYPYPGDDIYIERMTGLDPSRCRFITAPDVVCDPVGTLEKSLPMLPRIRNAGFPVAFVAQDGIENMDTPWGEFDILFLGGSTGWKLGDGAAKITAESLDRGTPVHMGRVNTRRRLYYAKQIGCTSVDGTFLRYGPDKNLPQLLRFLWVANNMPPELW